MSKEREKMRIYNPFVEYYPTKEEIKEMINRSNKNIKADKKEIKQSMSDDELIKRIYGID